MTIPSYLGLQTALRGLLAEQAAIDTTGNNIANANTIGYSRQTAVFDESDPYNIPAFSNVTGAGAQVGTGVDVSTIKRIRDQFLDIQYRTQNAATSDANTQATILDQVQTALAEPSDHGLSSQLSAFWSAWSDLANNPQSAAAQQTVLDSGQTVEQTFNSIYDQLGTIENQVDAQYQSIAVNSNGQVMSDATQIQTLNTEISHAEANGQTPNDLLDQRDKLLDDLSSLANVTTSDVGNGMVQVNFGDASTALVDSSNNVNWPQTLTAKAGGQLGALLTLHDPNSTTNPGTLETSRSDLDSFATTLVNSVNAAYAQGNASAPNFFTLNGDGTIKVAVSSVQASFSGAAGANDSALAVAGLSGQQADSQYAAFVAQIGSDAQSVQNTQQTQQAVLTAIGNQRQSVSGVSLDEETTNLITFQRGYQASARVMSTIDDMLDTLINHTGRVGL